MLTLELPSAMWSLIKNPIYMVACLLGCTDLAIVAGFLSFLTKYLETQFGLSKSTASIATGDKKTKNNKLLIIFSGSEKQKSFSRWSCSTWSMHGYCAWWMDTKAMEAANERHYKVDRTDKLPMSRNSHIVYGFRL